MCPASHSESSCPKTPDPRFSDRYNPPEQDAREGYLLELDLADVNIRARVYPRTPQTVHLELRYPNTPEYRDRVLGALADILRPKQPLNSSTDEASRS